MSTAVVKTDLKQTLPFLARGKVRDIYTIPDQSLLLFVATDRISAYDVILNNGIPNKGKILTQLSIFWFNYLGDVIQNHLLEANKKDQNKNLLEVLPSAVSNDSQIIGQLLDRSLIVRKFKLVPLEVIVRGYLTGSAWKEYQQFGTVHGAKYPPGMQESQQFETPIFTPSTKAEQGDHDENIDKARAVEILGGNQKLVDEIEKAAIALYTKANEYAKTRGIIIADTKFEFGLDENNQLVLVDEVLTPDSSRFWSADTYKLGQGQDSFDKQFLRNWLTDRKLNGVDDVTIPEDIVVKTKAKYVEVLEKLTGEKFIE
ncbi:phosphoribosylaminoimidazolesuccinocarboxamide synthase [Saccharomycopsis crataegensis]|uniref:Phosphoribosylaminoimidazole-succinocarboxamide synthase n=1 Tax=Saccharomycopsis crataegensis TaxID=43959 RepID=A0AAV5QLB7_9ASCO|nr:phosphoribosylaminoimidazolesuccinocarboxamide synthase [Saccharomycopsis crataegensis]